MQAGRGVRSLRWLAGARPGLRAGNLEFAPRCTGHGDLPWPGGGARRRGRAGLHRRLRGAGRGLL